MEKVFRLGTYLVGLMLVILFVQHVTTTKMEVLKKKGMLYSADVVSLKEREKQLDCLAINIYREAGYEPFEGKVAVGQVTMNRVANPAFPNDICAVVYQKNKVMERVVCQFSWYCDSTHRNRPVNREAYAESYAVAKKVLLEDFKLDSLKEALYYHADYVNPQWRLDKIGKVGQHIFYKPKEKTSTYAKL
jgi:spore germination cell wall hydrolase CwlJ-like protein